MEFENEEVMPEVSERMDAYWAGDDDWTDEEPVTEQPEANQPPEEPEAQPEEAPAEQTPAAEESFELVYNGEKLTRNRAQVIELAQKGMNYEKGMERARREGAAAHQQTIDALGRIADRMGQTPENLLSWMERQMHANAVNELVDGGMEQSAAEELVQLREGERMRSAQQQRDRQQMAAQNEQLKPWQDFWEKYPDKAAEYQSGNVPQAFRDAIEAGMPPVAAQAMLENAELRESMRQMKNDLEALQKGKENKNAAPPAVGSYGAKKELDPFMRGFLAED